jgi:hypothetical protein
MLANLLKVEIEMRIAIFVAHFRFPSRSRQKARKLVGESALRVRPISRFPILEMIEHSALR